MNPDDSTIEVEPPNDTAWKRTPTLTPYEMMLGQYTEDDIKMMNSVYNYIMNKNPEKDFGDETWIHNCYNVDLNMRSEKPQANNAHFPTVDITDEDCMEFKRNMNTRVYLNLLESDSIATLNSAEPNSLAVFAFKPPHFINHREAIKAQPNP